MEKIIAETKDYIILQETMDGLTITIRRWMLRGKFLDWYVDVLFDDSFAKTQGYIVHKRHGGANARQRNIR